MSALEVADVSFAYGARQALQDVSFSAASGRFTALLGPNGAGKSTLIALLTRLYDLQRGEIRVDGHSLREQPREALRRLGVVFQQSTLDLDLSVEQNLRYHAALHGMPRKLVSSLHRAAPPGCQLPMAACSRLSRGSPASRCRHEPLRPEPHASPRGSGLDREESG